ncbi:MAG: DNA topoisomerase IV subunit A [Desulforegulaceae bacterium]|nr:DNA topoisomerase IV subunit A [Desulforegulaceae bacterium]
MNEEKRLITEFAEEAYLEYAMYVIMDRALPRISDGLKPVQRRIVYAMSELGLSHTSTYKKSARTVGDVLGKFHPHGDSACYEAMVNLAQAFSIRYPLIDGQGNWGSQDDPKSFAAMRYTESKMTKYSSILLSELSLGTVDWGPNFDGTLKEPLVLPSRLPNIIINGSSGIAVGMSTDIPSHNLRESADACIKLLDFPQTSIEDLMEIIKGPDFACGGEIITPKQDILDIYKSGTGTVKVRGTFRVENNEIIIDSIPPYVSVSKLIEDIGSQMAEKKLPMVSDLRDESDHEDPLRIVITPKSKQINTAQLMDHLFATTDLEKTHRINLNYIGNNNKPQVTSIKELLEEWLEFRKITVTRRLNSRLDKINERLHILEGLKIAYLDLDEVIRIVRKEDKPKKELMKKFLLSEIQAEAILNIRLRALAKIEEEKILLEYSQLNKEKNEIELILNDYKLLKKLIKKEIKEARKEFGDKRKTKIVEKKAAKPLPKREIIQSEPITVVLSEENWIRAAKGHEIDPTSLSYKSGDKFKFLNLTKNTLKSVFIDSEGKAYSLDNHNLPSARSHGEPLSSRLNLPDQINITSMSSAEPESKFIFASDSGYGFISEFSNAVSKNKKGKNFLTVPKNSIPLKPLKIGEIENQLIAAVTLEGRLLIFEAKELPELARGKGNQIIRIVKKDFENNRDRLIILHLMDKENGFIIHSGKRILNITTNMIEDFAGKRGNRGKILPRGFRKVQKLVNKDD